MYMMLQELNYLLNLKMSLKKQSLMGSLLLEQSCKTSRKPTVTLTKDRKTVKFPWKARNAHPMTSDSIELNQRRTQPEGEIELKSLPLRQMKRTLTRMHAMARQFWNNWELKAKEWVSLIINQAVRLESLRSSKRTKSWKLRISTKTKTSTTLFQSIWNDQTRKNQPNKSQNRVIEATNMKKKQQEIVFHKSKIKD